jgi:long-chain acyl-CoA synthetase
MFHGGSHSYYMGGLHVGQGLVIMAKFDPEQTLQLIERHRIRTAYMVPTQFHRLLQLPEATRAKYDVSSLHSVVHSAAPCPRPVKEQMMAWWGPVIWETYGGMEGAATIAKPHRWLERPGTVGRAVRGMRVMILDDDGNELPSGEIGHIYMQSEVGSFRYHNDPDATAGVHRGKAFTIGDIGYLDDEGYLFICDRAREIIISGGVNIYPAEVEGVLTGNPAVADVAVIGVPDDEWGEQVKAVVELVGGNEPSHELAEEIIAYCKERLAGYKCPRSVDFADNLPRTDTGKLFKRRIRDAYWEDAGRSV